VSARVDGFGEIGFISPCNFSADQIIPYLKSMAKQHPPAHPVPGWVVIWQRAIFTSFLQ
jgi:hypothetical protein